VAHDAVLADGLPNGSAGIALAADPSGRRVFVLALLSDGGGGATSGVATGQSAVVDLSSPRSRAELVRQNEAGPGGAQLTLIEARAPFDASTLRRTVLPTEVLGGDGALVATPLALFGAYLVREGTVRVFRRAWEDGAMQTHDAPSPARALGLQLQTAGPRVFLTFDAERVGAVVTEIDPRTATVLSTRTIAGAVGRATIIDGANPTVVLTAFRRPPDLVATSLSGDAPPDVVLSNASMIAGGRGSHRAFTLYTERAVSPTTPFPVMTQRLGVWFGQDFSRRPLGFELGRGGLIEEGDLAVTPWGGAALAWVNDRGTLELRMVDGSGIGTSVALPVPGEDRARNPRIDAMPDGAVLAWVRVGSPPALRIARVLCR
jgi:hypothetical protein